MKEIPKQNYSMEEELYIQVYAQTLFLGARSDVFISSIFAATMKSFMLNPPAQLAYTGHQHDITYKMQFRIIKKKINEIKLK